MASIEEIYQKSSFANLPTKRDRTPISAEDFDAKKLSISDEQFERARGGKLSTKPYSDRSR